MQITQIQRMSCSTSPLRGRGLGAETRDRFTETDFGSALFAIGGCKDPTTESRLERVEDWKPAVLLASGDGCEVLELVCQRLVSRLC